MLQPKHVEPIPRETVCRV